MNNKYIVQAMSETQNHVDDPIDCGGYEEEEDVFESNDIDAYEFE